MKHHSVGENAAPPCTCPRASSSGGNGISDKCARQSTGSINEQMFEVGTSLLWQQEMGRNSLWTWDISSILNFSGYLMQQKRSSGFIRRVCLFFHVKQVRSRESYQQSIYKLVVKATMSKSNQITLINCLSSSLHSSVYISGMTHK